MSILTRFSQVESHYCPRTRIPEKMQLPIDITELIPSGPRGSEKGNNISCGILQLRMDRQRIYHDKITFGTYQDLG